MRHTPWFPTSAEALVSRLKTDSACSPSEGRTAANCADRLKLYKALRLERTSRVQALARAAGKLYRSEYKTPSERGERLRDWMAQGKWVLEHDAEKAVADALSNLPSR